jgi:D-alanyl-D-alanine carboxypeptidase
MSLKKNLLLSSCFIMVSFCACGKDSVVKKVEAVPAASAQVAQQQAATDPEVEKLGRVLKGMSDRAKEAIPNGDPKEFLADLHGVLDAEKAFPSDDISLFTLIDKQHPVADTYVPANLVPLVKNKRYTISRNDLSLRPDVEKALVELATAAQNDGITLMVSSTYRSFEYQKKVYAKWVAIDGQIEADRESARPGTSQHQLGAAIDFGSIDDDFWETKMGKWLYANSEQYGWSLSFPKNYEDVTGYRWECWHFRYIGKTACSFQKKWFGDIQQFMFEFLDAWKKAE